MTGDSFQGVRTDTPLSRLFMAILVTATLVLAVVEVNGLETIKANDRIKMRQHPIQIIHRQFLFAVETP